MPHLRHAFSVFFCVSLPTALCIGRMMEQSLQNHFQRYFYHPSQGPLSVSQDCERALNGELSTLPRTVHNRLRTLFHLLRKSPLSPREMKTLPLFFEALAPSVNRDFVRLSQYKQTLSTCIVEPQQKLTVLMSAVLKHQERILKEPALKNLFGGGIGAFSNDPQFLDKDGNNILHMVVKSGSVPMLEAFVDSVPHDKQKALFDHKNSALQLPFQLAEQLGHSDLLRKMKTLYRILGVQSDFDAVMAEAAPLPATPTAPPAAAPSQFSYSQPQPPPTPASYRPPSVAPSIGVHPPMPPPPGSGAASVPPAAPPASHRSSGRSTLSFGAADSPAVPSVPSPPTAPPTPPGSVRRHAVPPMSVAPQSIAPPALAPLSTPAAPSVRPASHLRSTSAGGAAAASVPPVVPEDAPPPAASEAAVAHGGGVASVAHGGGVASVAHGGGVASVASTSGVSSVASPGSIEGEGTDPPSDAAPAHEGDNEEDGEEENHPESKVPSLLQSMGRAASGLVGSLLGGKSG